MSLWQDDPTLERVARPPLPGPVDVDVAVVGAGYTGLWTALSLAEADPALRIVVLEAETVGFGASGRNGGWCSAIFPATLRKVVAQSSPDAARRMQAAMNDTVEEVRRATERLGIACDYARGGYVSVARDAAQWQRARAEVRSWRDAGFGEDQVRLLTAEEAGEHVRASRVRGATFTPHCAALHPAKLVHGLARAVEAAGVRVHEGTRVRAVAPGRVRTDRGDVRCEVAVLATEGYTPALPGHRRDLLPVYSLMIATEPLPADALAAVGLDRRPTFSDKRHLRIYGQRTADGRIAFGGRGAPYHYGSRVRPRFDRDRRVHAMLRRVLVDLLPPLHSVEVTHEWGGNLGVPRDWFPSVRFDRRTGIAVAGGYVGDGVASANLAGRTLRDLVLDRPSELRELPWTGHRSPRWEPEPLRWLGANASTLLFAAADRAERRTGRPSRAAAGFWRALGH